MPIYTEPTDLALLDPQKLSQALVEQMEAGIRIAERYDEDGASARPAAGKWSVKEVFGHLIDSAGNNLQRIVRLSLEPALQLPGYQQEGWVAVQHYADRPWSEVLLLWQALNRHLAHVIWHVKRDDLGHVWQFEGKPLALGFIIEDYVAHMQHHLKTLPEPQVLKRREIRA